MSLELRLALRWVWLIVSLIVLGVLIAPFILPEAALARLVPVCEAKVKANRECALCGMTTAFLAISNGRFADARAANRGGPSLYALFVLNEILMLAVLARVPARRWLCPH